MKPRSPLATLAWPLLLAFPALASANPSYSIDFTATDGSDVTATGAIVVSGGQAVSGSLDLQGSGWVTFPGTYALYTGPAAPASSDPTDFPGALPNSSISPNGYGTFDNLYPLDSAGLLFTNEVPGQTVFVGNGTGTGTLIEEVFLTYDGGGQFGLWDDFNAPDALFNGSAFPYDADQAPNGQYEFIGSFTANSNVPDGGATLLLLGMGTLALGWLRRRLV